MCLTSDPLNFAVDTEEYAGCFFPFLACVFLGCQA